MNLLAWLTADGCWLMAQKHGVFLYGP